MPRVRRIVFPGVPHHVTQRGNRRERVFFSDSDCSAYLRWLQGYASDHRVAIVAYCLMPNHVHLVAAPACPAGLHRMLRPLHMRYAQHVNRIHGWKGHLWQGRYFASALDESHLWAAIRYVERNPVRAGLVERAEGYPWSSASGHCGSWRDPLLTDDPSWTRRLAAVGDWSRWLAGGDDAACLDALRRNVERGLPCGSDTFIDGLEARSGRQLRRNRRGRPPRKRAASPI